eukprot:CAMPEP_0171111642 /NCGR_PEP_ID=MMETSP0766_2-20121228/75886_1 /TAXON_ID=439317 /ORGANISM="Gambierdiscus australes, Strain CAWD 149" /LENGTH=83 /DNA_ID=CAMNT_0011573647 /DNA_START=18 /DNA_END=267 /DNA_ORIENTATION=+
MQGLVRIHDALKGRTRALARTEAAVRVQQPRKAPVLPLRFRGVPATKDPMGVGRRKHPLNLTLRLLPLVRVLEASAGAAGLSE